MQTTPKVDRNGNIWSCVRDRYRNMSMWQDDHDALTYDELEALYGPLRDGAMYSPEDN